MSDATRNYLTAEEFLAQVAAYRGKRLKEPLKTTAPLKPGPFVRTYVIDWTRMHVPPRPKLIIPEDMP